jgi:hypothetical protein
MRRNRPCPASVTEGTMDRTRSRLCAAAAASMAALLAAACAAPASAPGKPSDAAASRSRATRPGLVGAAARRQYRADCVPSQLQLAAGPLVSERTRQHTLILLLRNTSARGCTMQGYPRITLTGAHAKTLPFSYRRRGDQMLTSNPPAPVPLPPGATAYLAINKNACVTFTTATASQVQVTPPGTRHPLAITLPSDRMDYCAPRDPGHTIDVIPVQRTQAGVYAQS